MYYFLDSRVDSSNLRLTHIIMLLSRAEKIVQKLSLSTVRNVDGIGTETVNKSIPMNQSINHNSLNISEENLVSKDVDISPILLL